MAKLEESVLSHVSIPQSEGEEDEEDGNAVEPGQGSKKDALVAGIAARERLLATQQAQLQSQNALIQKNLNEKLEQIRGEEVKIAGKLQDLRENEKKLQSRKG